jgi:hypothetical protein
VCMKSKTGDDFAVSADALPFLLARVNDPEHWIEGAFVVFAAGDSAEPASIVVVNVMTVAKAVERTRGATPTKGKPPLGPYHWLRADDVRPLDDDDQPF